MVLRGEKKKDVGEEHTCHFRHEGLKLGAPVRAPFEVVKT